MKSLFCSLFLLFCYTTTAQFANLIKDKNVAWVAESTIDVRLDLLYESDHKNIYEQTSYDPSNLDLTILKYQDTKSVEVGDGMSFFANTLLKAVENKQLTIYSDSLCVQAIDALSLLIRQDTIQQIDPNTYETTIRIVKSQLDFQDIKFFRAYQITYYSPKNNRWSSKTLAVAPLVMKHNELGNFVAWKPVFWIKVANEKIDLNASSTTWAVRRWSRSKENMLQLNTLKVHKKGNGDMPMSHFLNAVKTNPKLKVYRAGNWHDKALLSPTDKENLFVSVDTIQMIDPVTYETKTKIVRNELDATTTNKLQLVQEWAWDNKRKVLSVRCLGVAPMRDIKNQEGEFLFCMPIFYQRFDD